eukprot:scaffold44881_cov176-Amphora_coffeaeformis.AAC.3
MRGALLSPEKSSYILVQRSTSNPQCLVFDKATTRANYFVFRWLCGYRRPKAARRKSSDMVESNVIPSAIEVISGTDCFALTAAQVVFAEMDPIDSLASARSAAPTVRLAIACLGEE